MEKLKINNKDYTFLVQYKNDEALRMSFNSLTQKVYNFDYEKWYNSGYWKNNCLLYSLADGEKIVSHITVNEIYFIVLGEKKKFVQLGTVMTDPEYKNQGLSRFLMEKVLEEWENKCDMIYLFANDSVLEFYPKFDFVPVNEYQAVCRIEKEEKKEHKFRKLDMENLEDRNLLHYTAKHAVSLSKLSMQDNSGLIMFHANYFDRSSFKDNLYYIEDLLTIGIILHKETEIILYDVLALEKVDIKEVIHTLAQEQSQKATLLFMPNNSENYELSLFKEEDSTLFVQSKNSFLFENNKLLFSMLSHT